MLKKERLNKLRQCAKRVEPRALHRLRSPQRVKSHEKLLVSFSMLVGQDQNITFTGSNKTKVFIEELVSSRLLSLSDPETEHPPGPRLISHHHQNRPSTTPPGRRGPL